MNIGDKIKNIRKERSLTQEEFARQFHVTRQTVSNWENNKNYPDMETLRQISDAFGLSFDTLLKDDSEFLKQIDQTSRFADRRKRMILILAAFLCVLTTAWIIYLSAIPKTTDDGSRINTDTDIRMLVDLPGETPSRAITYTMRKDPDSHSEQKKVDSRISAASGEQKRIFHWDSISAAPTGDIPSVCIGEAPTIELYFQDTLYQNQEPSQIVGVTVKLLNVYSDEADSFSPAWELKKGRITFPLETNISSVAWENDFAPYRLAIIAEYVIDETTYVSVTVLDLKNTP